MIAPTLARRLILNRIGPLTAESVTLEAALGRVLAADVVAPVDLPPFNHSAMDGFAVHSGDTAQASHAAPVRLPVIMVVAAGADPAAAPSGTAARIMTGAMLPAGTDAVVPFEKVLEADGEILLQQPVATGDNVRRAGEDVQAGRRILVAGDDLSPARLALLAGLGVSQVSVHRRPRVAIVTTGNELVAPGEPLPAGRIYDSNTTALMALVREAGGEPVLLGVAGDDETATRLLLQQAAGYDLVITSGGVSMGDYDHVGKALAELGTVHFTHVAQQPGKPMTFASLGETPVFALPGTPVAVLVTFEYYVRPALRELMGHTVLDRPSVTVRLLDAIQLKPDRTQFLRAVLHVTPQGFQARLSGGHNAKHLSAMAFANALLVIQPGVGRSEPGASGRALILEPDALYAESHLRPPDNDLTPLMFLARKGT